MGELGLEGGSIEVDDATRESATQALSEMVSEWSPPEPSADVAPDGQEGLTTIGATSWRPVTGQPVEGRYVSESPRLKEHDANEVDRVPRPARKRRAVKASAPPAPSLRKPQRLPSRKPEPALPSIGEGVPALQSSAVVSSAPTLPDWPAERTTNRAYRKENMDGFEQRQERAIQRQSGVPRPLQTSSLRDNVNTSPNLEGSKLPAPSVPRTVELPVFLAVYRSPTAFDLLNLRTTPNQGRLRRYLNTHLTSMQCTRNGRRLKSRKAWMQQRCTTKR